MRRRQLTVWRMLKTVFVLPRFEQRERKRGVATMGHEPWPHRIFADDRLPSGSGVPPMRGALQRRSAPARVLLLGPALVHRVRAGHLSRKSTIHSGLLAELAGPR